MTLHFLFLKSKKPFVDLTTSWKRGNNKRGGSTDGDHDDDDCSHDRDLESQISCEGDDASLSPSSSVRSEGSHPKQEWTFYREHAPNASPRRYGQKAIYIVRSNSPLGTPMYCHRYPQSDRTRQHSETESSCSTLCPPEPAARYWHPHVKTQITDTKVIDFPLSRFQDPEKVVSTLREAQQRKAQHEGHWDHPAGYETRQI
jgi:hypothetical protein